MTETYEPKVIATVEFRELANDFQHAFEAVREAIANSYDHGATEIRITCEMIKTPEEEKPLFRLRLDDNGSGMTGEMLHAFFDIGNSIKPPEGPRPIGYKGHGTKVYFRSRKIDVVTAHQEGERYHATLDRPWLKMRNKEKLSVEIEPIDMAPGKHGTWITISGYFDNKGHLFTQEMLKDYILWYTAHGSARLLFDTQYRPQTKLLLKGVDVGKAEEVTFGHPMAREEVLRPKDIPEDEDPNDYKRLVFGPFTKQGITDPSGLEYKVEIAGVVAGEKARYKAPKGIPARRRFGLWRAKDYIPVDWRPDWVASDQSYLLFHFVVNCDQFSLTANRGSVSNTDPELMEAVQEVAQDFIQNDVLNSAKFKSWIQAREEAEIQNKRKKQYKKLERREGALRDRARLGLPGSLEFVPRNESETNLVLESLIAIGVTAVPFIIADAETKVGIDLLVRSYDSARQELVYRVFEVEYELLNFFAHKHGLSQVHGIVCWTDDGYRPGVTFDYEDKKVSYVVTGPRGSLQTKAIFTGGVPIPVYVLSDIVEFVRHKRSEATTWTQPFHCKTCGRNLSCSIADFVEHVSSH